MLCNVFVTSAQQEPFTYIKEISEFRATPSYSSEIGKQYNPEEFWSHPDFGKMTFASPLNKNVVEDISKRKIDERYYVDLDDPAYFYIEKSSIPINFHKDGHLRAIDYSLHQTLFGYEAVDQPNPTSLNLFLKNTSLMSEKGSMKMNQDFMKVTYMNNSTQIYASNWNNLEVSNFKAYFTDYFPGVDKKITFNEGSVKSEYIIKQNLGVKKIEFIDEIELDQNLEIVVDDYSILTRNFVQIKDVDSDEIMILGLPALTYDGSSSRASWISDYDLNGNLLSVICDSAVLNDVSMVYPITVDPLFTAVGPVAGANLNSDLAPAFCSQNLNINYPGGSTPWDVSLTWNVLADWCGSFWIATGLTADCWMSDSQLWFTSSCGGASPTGAPAIIWTCLAFGCDNPGNWGPTLNFGDDPSTQTLVQCYTPSCANQTITITSNLNRTACAGGFFAGFGQVDNCLSVLGNTVCLRMTAWSATVQGRTAETLGNTATGNGSLSIYDADCAGTQTLDPTPLYGVPGYTYSWNPGGATSSTLVVPGTVSTYTCDVTDACGNTVTATFDIGCPLSADELTVKGDRLGNEVALNWTTKSEKELSHFVIERSFDGEEWTELSTIDAKIDWSDEFAYEALDSKPLVGMNYYRVSQYHVDESFGYSETIRVLYRDEFTIYPNPAEYELTVEIPGTVAVGTQLVITDILGKVVYRQTVEQNSSTIDLSNFDKGNYFVRLEREGNIREVERLTIR